MSDFCSDLKDTSFVKSLDNAVADFYEQYLHDVVDVSRLTKNDSIN